MLFVRKILFLDPWPMRNVGKAPYDYDIIYGRIICLTSTEL